MSAYSDAILALNPVGYWRLGETSGTNANDESSNNNDGTYTNTTLNQTSLVPADTNPAVRFNSATGGGLTVTKMQAPRHADYEIAASLTLALWMKPTTPYPGGSNRAPVAYSTTDVDPWPWSFGYHGNANFPDAYSFASGHGATRHHLYSFGDQDQPATDQQGDGDQFPLDEGAFVVCTFDGTTKQMFKNGCLIAYDDVSALSDINVYNATDTLKFGMGPYGHDASFNWWGYLDEVAVFDSVLTEAQIQNLYGIGVDFDSEIGCFSVPEPCALIETDGALLVDTTYQGSVTVTLMDPPPLVGHVYYIKNIGSGTATLDPGSLLIDDLPDYTLDPYDSVAIITTGYAWYIVSDYRASMS